jgi:hypothetical protein
MGSAYVDRVWSFSGVTGGRPSSFQWSYGMGDPMAPSELEGNSEGGGTARWAASREAKRAGITRP